MSDIIHLLPDSIANQIAAGEVIQRPASIVKELVENAIDAGATTVRVYIKDAGRTLVQVIDNGRGMSETDARMAFERHATSKIASADDLFSLHTMGFRGEALASIAAVAQVELRTRLENAELGTRLLLSGSNLQEIEPDACSQGSNFAVKNLFFNVPARRKFLKSNDTEFRNILTEFERIALVNPLVELSLHRDDVEIFNLPESGLRQRIVNVCGKGVNQKLISVEAPTSLVSINGFVGRPDAAKKRGAMQYFFVNGRFMKHPYFHRAVMMAYEQLIPTGDMPDYFIYFELDPACIDVNIHPTKTEIKFENEQAIWKIIASAVREALGKSNAVPSIDFDTEGALSIPVYTSGGGAAPIKTPDIQVNTNYNPFRSTPSYKSPEYNWDELYKQFEGESSRRPAEETFDFQAENTNHPLHACYQYKGRYIVTSIKSGLALVDQHRAHVRILYDRYLARIRQHKGISQQMLFPEIIEFTPAEAATLPAILEQLYFAGFDLSHLGSNSYAINGVPAGILNVSPVALVRDAVQQTIETDGSPREDVNEAIALSLAKAAAIPAGKPLSPDEMNDLIASLFASPSSTYAPDGKLIVSICTDDELEKHFK